MKRQRKYTNNDQKATYVSPELKVYGKLSELTHSGVAGAEDLGGSFTAFDTLPPISGGLN